MDARRGETPRAARCEVRQRVLFGDALKSGIFRANRFPNWVSPGLIVRTPQLRGKACQRYINLPCSAPLRQLKFPSLRKLSERLSACSICGWGMRLDGRFVPMNSIQTNSDRLRRHFSAVMSLPLRMWQGSWREASRCSQSPLTSIESAQKSLPCCNRSTAWHTPLAGRNVSQLLCWNVQGSFLDSAECS